MVMYNIIVSAEVKPTASLRWKMQQSSLNAIASYSKMN